MLGSCSPLYQKEIAQIGFPIKKVVFGSSRSASSPIAGYFFKDLKALAKETKGMFLRNFEPSQRRQLCPESNVEEVVRYRSS